MKATTKVEACTKCSQPAISHDQHGQCWTCAIPRKPVSEWARS